MALFSARVGGVGMPKVRRGWPGARKRARRLFEKEAGARVGVLAVRRFQGSVQLRVGGQGGSLANEPKGRVGVPECNCAIVTSGVVNRARRGWMYMRPVASLRGHAVSRLSASCRVANSVCRVAGGL